MSDPGRKDLTSKVTETITPDTHKSTTEHTRDVVSGKADHAGSVLQPDSTKSSTQATVDASHSDATVGDKIKSAVGLDKH
ncbi:hypothetical protein AAFC00_006537 [Neodothiora populina]|uniref:Chaperone/heat shock protein Hsp12 n=1 Tax=Neodothiora populina TaxID=2781224 RepID=A0ABR3PAJ6_9PEZI